VETLPLSFYGSTRFEKFFKFFCDKICELKKLHSYLHQSKTKNNSL